VYKRQQLGQVYNNAAGYGFARYDFEVGGNLGLYSTGVPPNVMSYDVSLGHGKVINTSVRFGEITDPPVVVPEPEVPFSARIDYDKTCRIIGSSHQFVLTDLNPGQQEENTTYEWKVNGQLAKIGTEKFLDYTFDWAGLHTVRLIMRNPNYDYDFVTSASIRIESTVSNTTPTFSSAPQSRSISVTHYPYSIVTGPGGWFWVEDEEFASFQLHVGENITGSNRDGYVDVVIDGCETKRINVKQLKGGSSGGGDGSGGDRVCNPACFYNGVDCI